jgi:GH24 family phage-related lysozyme (muramidase)
MRLSEAGLSLIKEFEGLQLTAYKCAASVWTIGYGHTGPDVEEGQQITEQQADRLLLQDCESSQQCVSSFVHVPLNQYEYDALVSFVFNVGPTAFINSTLCKLLLSGTERSIVASEFSRWVKAGTKILPGLVRRRTAEKELFLRKVKHPKLTHSLLAKQDTWLKRKPVDAAKLAAEEKLFVPKGSAWEWAEIRRYPSEAHQQIFLTAQPDTEWWFFPDHWKVINDAPPAPAPSAPAISAEIKLKVPYYSQRDNARDPMRTCFSSSCAMLLAALKPGSISGDDAYINTVFRHGDTTQAWVQLRALADYGVKAEFLQNGNWTSIETQLTNGIPVPIGILHHGPVSRPHGSGHWIVVIGITADKQRFIVHDPFGDLDLVNGGYLSTNGNSRLYSKKNLAARWLVEGKASGWFVRAVK